MDVVRGATFIGTLLLGWISLHPFVSLGDMQLGDVGTGNEVVTYATFGCLSVLTVALAMAKIDFTYECADCGAEVRQTVVKPELRH